MKTNYLKLSLQFAFVVVCSTACGAEPKTRPAAVDAGPPEAGVIKGTTTTSDGRPLKAFGGTIVTATATLTDGTTRRLRVTPYYSFKEKDARAPAETAVLEFVQSKPASGNINGANEINVHVMF